jgi:excisionase family DNA binding protein
MQELLLREDEAIALTKLSKTTLWRERREGRLRAIKIGRALRFPVSEVQRWIDQQLKAGEPEDTRDAPRW